MLPITFTPRYSFNVYLSLILMALIAAVVLFNPTESFPWPWNLPVAFGVGSLVVLAPFRLPKAVRFSEEAIVLERFLMRPKKFRYSEISDINGPVLLIGGTKVSGAGMRNQEEWRGLLDRLMEQEQVRESTLTDELLVADTLGG